MSSLKNKPATFKFSNMDFNKIIPFFENFTVEISLKF